MLYRFVLQQGDKEEGLALPRNQAERKVQQSRGVLSPRPLLSPKGVVRLSFLTPSVEASLAPSCHQPK